MEKYFNIDENFGKHSAKTIRIIDAGEGFRIMKGGMINGKGKLIQAEMIAFCETKEEAKELVKKLCEL